MRLTLPPGLVDSYRRLTSRERALLFITGGAAVLIVNLLLLSILLRSARELGSAYTERSEDVRREQLFANQKDSLWVPREAWLKKTQPTLNNGNVEGPRLLETIQALARSNQVLVVSPQILPFAAAAPPGSTVPAPTDYQAVTVKVTTQSDWQNVVRFMAAVQRPDAFLVFDSATLRTEQSDPKKMIGDFVISKWYAPAEK